MAERFDVLDQTQTVGRLDDGTFGDVIRVKYQAKPTGVVGTVDIPLSSYTARQVADTILARVDAHDQVAGL